MFEGICAHCARHTHFTARTAYIHERRDRASVSSPWPHVVEVAATCDNCKRFNTCIGIYESTNAFDVGSLSSSTVTAMGDKMTSRVWSPPPLLPVDVNFMPDGVAGFLQEAHDAMSIGAHRAVLLLVRSTIEATARDKGIESGTLVQKINQLHAGEHLRSGTRDMAHALRILGNDMAHGEISSVPSKEDANDALTIARFVLDDVYVADARRADIMARRA